MGVYWRFEYVIWGDNSDISVKDVPDVAHLPSMSRSLIGSHIEKYNVDVDLKTENAFFVCLRGPCSTSWNKMAAT